MHSLVIGHNNIEAHVIVFCYISHPVTLFLMNSSKKLSSKHQTIYCVYTNILRVKIPFLFWSAEFVEMLIVLIKNWFYVYMPNCINKRNAYWNADCINKRTDFMVIYQISYLNWQHAMEHWIACFSSVRRILKKCYPHLGW